MPTQTPNYNLTKPLKTENYNVDVFNGNFDIIDSALKQSDTTLKEKANKNNAEFTGSMKLSDKNIATTEVKTLTLLNGWVPLDKTPTITISGQIACVNLRIKNGVFTDGTKICELGITSTWGVVLFPITNYSGVNNGGVYVENGSLICGAGINNNTELNINIVFNIVGGN